MLLELMDKKECVLLRNKLSLFSARLLLLWLERVMDARNQ